MKRIQSKLTGAFAVLLLCVAAVTTANSQENPTKVIDLNALAARGEALANEDPLALELRNQQPDDSARRGFDIGMGVAEGHTLPGPGKDRTCASLPAGGPEGCSIAVSFSVERNRPVFFSPKCNCNVNLAAIGAKIAQADAAVAEARNAEPDNPRYRSGPNLVFYRLGFDIATGIFGNPALGAQGNTATGPGSLKIRDSLSRTGRIGFNASVKFHLGQEPPLSTPTPSGPTPRPRTPGEGTFIENSGKRDVARDKVYADWKNVGTEPSNEIRCRGYSRAGGSEYVFFTIDSRPRPTGETIVTYEIAYTPSLQAAGSKGEGLRPGECAWADRPIGDGQALRIRFETVANAQLKQQLHGIPLDTSPTAAERFPDVSSIPIYLKGETHYWSFRGVTNTGRGYFQATGHGYWKPTISLEDGIRLPADNTGFKQRKRAVIPARPE